MKVFIILFAMLAFVKSEETTDDNEQEIDPFDVRIVGGYEADPNSFPYQAAVYINASRGRVFCSGSIISKMYVLTAGHCLNRTISSIEVILGAHNISEIEDTQQRIISTNYTIHEEFNRTSLRNDIGIIYLPEDINFTACVYPIRLPHRVQSSNSFAGYKAISSGWGRISDSVSTLNDVIRYVNLTIITNEECLDIYPRYIQDTNICTNGTGGVGNCGGDSGGPLVSCGVLVGIISFSSSMGCEAERPSGYTRVTSYLDWIEEHSDIVIL